MTLETQTTAKTYAQQIETSVKEKNGTNYGKVLNEVHDYMQKNPATAQELQSSVVDQLKADRMFGQVTLFEMKDRFDSMDFVGNGVLNKAEVTAYRRSTQNELEQVFLDDRTSSMNGYAGLGRTGIDQELQNLDDKENRRTLINHFFQQPGPGQPSLYERLANSEGNIPPSALNKLMSADQSLSDLDRRTLKLMEEKDNGAWFHDDYKVDRLKNLCKENDADFGVKPAPLPGDKTEAPAVPPVAEVQKNTPPVQSDTDVQPSAVTTPPPPSDAQPSAVTTPPPPSDVQPSAVTTPTPPSDVQPSTVTTPPPPSDVQPPAAPAPLTPKPETTVKPAPNNSDSTTTTPTDNSSLNKNDSKTEQQKQRDDALANAATIQKKNESYAHCALRLLALMGVHDPSGKQLRVLAHLLWKTNGSKRAGALHLHERLEVTDEVKHYLSGQRHH